MFEDFIPFAVVGEESFPGVTLTVRKRASDVRTGDDRATAESSVPRTSGSRLRGSKVYPDVAVVPTAVFPCPEIVRKAAERSN